MFLAAVGAVINLIIVPPTYAVRARLEVDFSSTSVQSSLVIANYVGTQINYIQTKPFLQGVAASIPGVTVATLAKEISADPITGSQFFEIVVNDTNPNRGALIANTVASKLVVDARNAMAQLNLVAQQTVLIDVDNAQADLNSAIQDARDLRVSGVATQQQLVSADAIVREMETRFLNISQGLVSLQVTQASNLYLIRIVDLASPTAVTKNPPRTLVIGLALSLGILAGLVGLLASDIFVEYFRPITDLADVVSWELLGRVRVRGAMAKPPLVPDDREGFGATLNSLRFLDLAAPTRRIAIVGIGRGNAASEVAAGLALAGASAGQRTLLIDAAFPQGSQAQRFGVNAQPGLTEALLDMRDHAAATPGNYLQSATTVTLPDLRLLTTGRAPAVASRVAGSPALRDQIFALAQRLGASLVIVDASAPGHRREMARLASGADAVVVVADLRTARQADVIAAAQMLEAAQANVAGYVVASAEPNTSTTELTGVNSRRSAMRALVP
jgi:Mrp family chromosome partitioning ATPase